jgi:hypothetical protein
MSGLEASLVLIGGVIVLMAVLTALAVFGLYLLNRMDERA